MMLEGVVTECFVEEVMMNENKNIFYIHFGHRNTLFATYHTFENVFPFLVKPTFLFKIVSILQHILTANQPNSLTATDSLNDTS